MDELRRPRAATAVFVGIGVFLLSLPTVLFAPVLGWEDFVFGQFWLPTGSLLICVFVTRKCGWGSEPFAEEASAGAGIGFPRAFTALMKFVVPFLILATMAVGFVR